MAKRGTKKRKEAPPAEPATDAPEIPTDGSTLEGDGAALEEKLEALERELEAVRTEAGEAADRALRTLAEFDNYRRRSERERDRALATGRADVLGELLEVVDNFERALAHAGDDVPEAFLEGMRLVARGLHDLLDRKGVERIEAEGRPFDPRLHDALTRQPADGVEANTVLQEIQPGYTVGESVLRPAKVIVAAPAPSGGDE